MTKMNLSGYLTLPIYNLLQQLAIETNEPLPLWLHRIAAAASTEEKPPSNFLRLRPNNSWRVFVKRERKEHYRRPGFVRGWKIDAPAREYAGSSLVTVEGEWTLETSWLSSFKKAPSLKEPPSLKRNLDFEGIEVHRDDFRAWLESEGRPLPRFWFPDEDRAANPARQLAESRHGPARPSTASVQEIVSTIQQKERTGAYWHQSTECQSWLDNHPSSKTSLKRLKDEVNRKLKESGLAPIKNAPRK